FELIEKDDRRRGGGGGGGGSKPTSNGGRGRSKAAPPISSNAETAFSRATGNNSVVVKVLSYGSGAGSARNVLAYQSKEERARDQDGREVSDLNAAVREWEREFGNRQGSKDIARFSYELEQTDRE